MKRVSVGETALVKLSSKEKKVIRLLDRLHGLASMVMKDGRTIKQFNGALEAAKNCFFMERGIEIILPSGERGEEEP